MTAPTIESTEMWTNEMMDDDETMTKEQRALVAGWHRTNRIYDELLIALGAAVATMCWYQ